MNTRQKLTLGIAAIFMVTLTIVGVTYAYFVTRVDGDEGTQVQASTVTLGSVKYVQGNGTSDKITLSDQLPGAAVYKTFSVTNETTDTNAASSYYTIFTSNNVADGKGEFIHTVDGLNSGDGTNNATDVLYNCYGYKNNNVLDTTVVEPKMSTELTGEANAAVKSLCFNATATSKYNNIRVSLYQVDQATMQSYATNNTSDLGAKAPTSPLSTVARKQLTFNAQDDIKASIEIAPKETHYYVLEVKYLDTAVETQTTDTINGNVGIGDNNQNAENLAGLDVIVSIKA